MSEKTIKVRFCDKCDKPIEGRLTLHTCPCCGKDICVECQEKEDNRHKPRERKQKAEQVSAPPAEAPTDDDLNRTWDGGTLYEPKTVRKRGRKLSKDKILPSLGDMKEKKLSLTIVRPQYKHQLAEVSIGEFSCTAPTLKGAVNLALANFNGKIPDGLSDEDKRNLLDILKESEA